MEPDTTALDPAGVTLMPELPDYGAFAERLRGSCRVWGPWIAGQPRFHSAPLVVAPALRDRFHAAAADLGRVYNALCERVWEQPALLDDFLGLTPWQKGMWVASGGRWHGFARFDLFLCQDGRIQVCEINADTPSGQDDAVPINELLAPDHPRLHNPNADYEPLLWATMVRYHQAVTGHPGGPRVLGLVYPTEMPEDITLIGLYMRWLRARGVEVVQGSPFNLTRDPAGGVRLMGRRVDMVMRHYKTDWWAEREPAWLDEDPYPDPDPIEAPMRALLEAEASRKVSVFNPFGAVVPQNKRAMALLWEHRHDFEPHHRATIEALIPETRRAELIPTGELLAGREGWVLKSDYGCESDEVVVGRWCSPQEWEQAVAMMRPGRWVAQRYFEVQPLDARWLPNYGVYLVGGTPVGLFARLAPLGRATDFEARVAPTFVGPTRDTQGES